ncbi:MAG: hypothetical protein IKR04_04780 [Clostridia bacterium]|nr:hypothetical protein [Clostridia bacterium]
MDQVLSPLKKVVVLFGVLDSLVAVAALPVQEADEPVILISQEPDAPPPVFVGT